jgi:hypothetical protein
MHQHNFDIRLRMKMKKMRMVKMTTMTNCCLMMDSNQINHRHPLVDLVLVVQDYRKERILFVIEHTNQELHYAKLDPNKVNLDPNQRFELDRRS